MAMAQFTTRTTKLPSIRMLPCKPPPPLPPTSTRSTDPLTPQPLTTQTHSTLQYSPQHSPPPNPASSGVPITAPVTSLGLVAHTSRHLLDRRLNCLSAKQAGNPYITQCKGCHKLRCALPLKQLAAALQLRACYSQGPQLLKGCHTLW